MAASSRFRSCNLSGMMVFLNMMRSRILLTSVQQLSLLDYERKVFVYAPLGLKAKSGEIFFFGITKEFIVNFQFQMKMLTGVILFLSIVLMFISMS
jgi:hypothetical protein